MTIHAQAPLLTVVVPTYNGSKYIGETLRSLIDQTFRSMEIIVIDDASTDNTTEIVQAFNDPRIRLIRNEKNLGVAHTRNRAFAEARGRYLSPHDQDDISEPHRFAKQIALMEENPALDIVGSWIATFGDSHETWKYPESDQELKCRFIFGCEIAHTTAVIRKTAIPTPDRVYDPDLALCSDYDLFSRLALKGKIHNLQEPLVRYRRHKDALSRTALGAMRTCARTLHHRLLLRFGIDATEMDLDLHDHIGRGLISSADRYALERVGKWLTELYMANLRKGVVPRQEFRRVLYNYWHNCCRRAAAEGNYSPIDYLGNRSSWTLGLLGPLIDARNMQS